MLKKGEILDILESRGVYLGNNLTKMLEDGKMILYSKDGRTEKIELPPFGQIVLKTRAGEIYRIEKTEFTQIK